MEGSVGSSATRRAILDGLMLSLLLLAANVRGLVVSPILPFNGALLEIGIESILTIGAIWILSSRRRSLSLADALVWNPGLLALGAWSAASLLWTVDERATSMRLLALILSTALAAYMATRYSRDEILAIAATMFGALEILCVLAALVWPAFGRMNSYPYYGSWRGIFWHRNYLGATMGLAAMVCLLACVGFYTKSRRRASIYFAFYLMALTLVVLSRSATGLILTIILHGFFGLAWAWVRLQARMRALHYWLAGAVLLALGIIAYLKLDILLGLFNRDSNFTGRVGLWQYLFAEVIDQRPLLGHGFGALWTHPAFTHALQGALGWPYPVMIGDNGYVDILLHLGYVGLALLLVALGFALARCAGLVLRERNLPAFAPLLALAWLLIANFTLSYFLETESFTWLITLALVCAASTGTLRAATPREKIATSSVS